VLAMLSQEQEKAVVDSLLERLDRSKNNSVRNKISRC
jgi:hypothetical protein